jgi:hypothetical protein
MNNETESVSLASTVKIESTPRERYLEAVRNYRCARGQYLRHEYRKMFFHLRGLCRAILGI